MFIGAITVSLLLLEPMFEADLTPEQYFYRPGRNAQQAASEVQERLHRGQTDVDNMAQSE